VVAASKRQPLKASPLMLALPLLVVPLLPPLQLLSPLLAVPPLQMLVPPLQLLVSPLLVVPPLQMLVPPLLQLPRPPPPTPLWWTRHSTMPTKVWPRPRT